MINLSTLSQSTPSNKNNETAVIAVKRADFMCVVWKTLIRSLDICSVQHTKSSFFWKYIWQHKNVEVCLYVSCCCCIAGQRRVVLWDKKKRRRDLLGLHRRSLLSPAALRECYRLDGNTKNARHPWRMFAAKTFLIRTKRRKMIMGMMMTIWFFGLAEFWVRISHSPCWVQAPTRVTRGSEYRPDASRVTQYGFPSEAIWLPTNTFLENKAEVPFLVWACARGPVCTHSHTHASAG